MIVTQDDGTNARLVVRFPLRRLLLVALTLANGHPGAALRPRAMLVLLRAMSLGSAKLSGATRRPPPPRSRLTWCRWTQCSWTSADALRRRRRQRGCRACTPPARTSWTRGLMSYDMNTRDSWWRSATYVDKILKGAAPGEVRDSGCEAYTAIAWGVGLSHERSSIVGAESFYSLESNMCSTAMRGVVTLPGSKATSRAKGSRRKLGDLVSGRDVLSTSVRIGKARSRSR